MRNWIIGGVLLALTLPVAAQDPAGRVVLVIGQAYATNTAGVERNLGKGSAIYSGDTLATLRHSYVNVEYSDKGRTLVGPESQLKIEDYAYKPPPPLRGSPSRRDRNATAEPEGRTVFSLLRGSFRAVTGLIGQRRRADYSIRTPVVTIGIRGTDAVYMDCSDGRCGDLGPGSSEDPNSVLVGVYSGGITATNTAGQSIDVDPDQFVQATRETFHRLAGMPGVLVTMPMTDPESCE